MYHIKNDRRAKRSAETIYEALVKLMGEKRFADIRVTDLVEQAQLARATFYRSFDVQEDVLRWRCDQVLDELEKDAETAIGLLDRLAACFSDYRNPLAIEHSVQSLVSQRVYGLALGYEDLNDHDVLRKDSVLALLVGKQELTGDERIREQDRGKPLAASSTLNRLGLSTPDSAPSDRYKKIAADPDTLDRLLIDVFLESQRKPPREI